MADDAAGAVRRTPRPAPKPPAAWWSPTEGFWSTDQRRPVVLLRADDCDCGPPYADCKHGPEPVDALDLAVWLHGEASWRADQNQRELARLYSHHHDFVAQAAAERDALQARITDVVAKINGYDGYGAGMMFHDELLAALQGDQPAAGSKYRDVELAYWRGRAETAEQRLKDAANFYPDVPPEPPVGTTYSYPDGSTAWVRREDGWHCGRTEPCRNCPCEWQEAWDFGIRDPRLTRILGDQPSEQPRPLIPPDDPCQDLRCRRVDGRCVGMHCAHCGEPCGAQGHTCSTDAAGGSTGEADHG